MQTVDDCLRVDGLKALFIRKVQKTATESMEDIVYRALQFTDYDFTPSSSLRRPTKLSGVVHPISRLHW